MSEPKKYLIEIKPRSALTHEQMQALKASLEASEIADRADFIVVPADADVVVHQDLGQLVDAIAHQTAAISRLAEYAAQSVGMTADLVDIIAGDDGEEENSYDLSGKKISVD